MTRAAAFAAFAVTLRNNQFSWSGHNEKCVAITCWTNNLSGGIYKMTFCLAVVGDLRAFAKILHWHAQNSAASSRSFSPKTSAIHTASRPRVPTGGNRHWNCALSSLIPRRTTSLRRASSPRW